MTLEHESLPRKASRAHIQVCPRPLTIWVKPKQGKAQELKDDLCDVFWRRQVEQQIPASDAQLALRTGAAKIEAPIAAKSIWKQ